ncbi:hypothetical protein VCSRO11_2083 [Vibrio cholerae]|nr:hypothetical protein VCSRO11_2083 [Vibrio cholerae]
MLSQSNCERLTLKERQQLELTEIELNRARIIMIDENGKMIRLPLLTEH